MVRLTDDVRQVSWDQSEIDFWARLEVDDDGNVITVNGFVLPHFSIDEVERYAEYASTANAEHGAMFEEVSIRYQVGTPPYLDVTPQNGDGTGYLDGYLVVPDEHGLYPLGPGWTWMTLDDPRPVILNVRLVFKPTVATGPLELEDVKASLVARLDEVYVTNGNVPIKPEIVSMHVPPLGPGDWG